MQKADLIVIGAGPGGFETAAAEAAKGRDVVIIERDLAGGTCLNRGCIPTKCLCASASTILTVKAAAEFGVNVPEGVTADYGKATERMRGIVAGLRADVESSLSKCRYVHGQAAFNAAGNVVVDGEEYSAPQILIATGSRPAALPIPGAELALTSDDFLHLDSLPASVAVIGGGVIGLEFASIMAAFGTEVTVIEYCKEVLPPFDAEVAKRLRSYLSRRGIKFITGAAVTAIAAEADGKRAVTYTGKKGEAVVVADAVLMSVGRRAVVPDGLAEAGIELTPRGFIAVNATTFETSRPGVYAVGDCNGLAMLAHAATAQSRRVFGEDVDMSVIPAAVFTEPEAAMAGMTEQQALDAGIDAATSKAMFAGSGKARAMGHPDGFVKVVYSKGDRRILGAHIVGPHAADLITELALAIQRALTLDDIAVRLIHTHPTLAEVVSAACSR